MTQKETNTNIKFDICETDGAIIETIDGPGDIGNWLCSPEAPYYITILPIEFDSFSSKFKKEDLYKIVRTQLDENLNELSEKKQIWLGITDLDEDSSLKLAKEYKCDHYFHILWDAERFIYYYDLKEDDQMIWAWNGEL